MTRLQAFYSGVTGMDKEAKGGKGGMLPMALMDPGVLMAAALGAPLVVGAGAGALASKITSPTSSLTTAQKEMVLAELQQSIVDLKRRAEMANKQGRTKVTAINERPLHL